MQGEVYILELWINEDITLDVGSLGEIYFPSGRYFYVGRAKRWIMKRIERHFRRKKNLRWHIDYLTSNSSVNVTGAYILPYPADMEDKVAGELSNICEVIVGFGSSDTRAIGHLFRDCKNIIDLIRNAKYIQNRGGVYNYSGT